MQTESLPSASQPVFSQADEDLLRDYRSISAIAVVGFLLSLASPLVFVRPILIFIPLLAGSLCAAAISRISRSDGRLIGKTVAVLGLCCVSICVAALPSFVLVRNSLFNQHAEPVAQQWFDWLRQGSPQKALQMTVPAGQRQPLDDTLWDFYRGNEEARKALEQFVEREEIRLLLSLGENAEVRCYDYGQVQWVPSQGFGIEQLYAISYNVGEEKHSFLMRIQLQRSVSASGEIEWRVLSFEGGLKPTGWGT